jgi:hypothetical protein
MKYQDFYLEARRTIAGALAAGLARYPGTNQSLVPMPEIFHDIPASQHERVDTCKYYCKKCAKTWEGSELKGKERCCPNCLSPYIKRVNEKA